MKYDTKINVQMLLIKTMALEKFPNPTHTVVNDKQLTRRGEKYV